MWPKPGKGASPTVSGWGVSVTLRVCPCSISGTVQWSKPPHSPEVSVPSCFPPHFQTMFCTESLNFLDKARIVILGWFIGFLTFLLYFSFFLSSYLSQKAKCGVHICDPSTWALFCAHECLTCMYGCAPHVCRVPCRDQKRVLDSPELELRIVRSYYVDAEGWTEYSARGTNALICLPSLQPATRP